MKSPQRDPLLDTLLADEALERVRARSLAAGLGAMRARRRQRALLATATSLAIACLGGLIAQRQTRLAPAPLAAPTPRPNLVRMITDEELLARFSDRPAALVGAPGQQRLVFLDGKTSASPRK